MILGVSASRVVWGSIGIMERKMETVIQGLGLSVFRDSRIVDIFKKNRVPLRIQKGSFVLKDCLWWMHKRWKMPAQKRFPVSPFPRSREKG